MLAIGERFDRYTIEALLGRGGMGEVYRAFDPRLERRVALKVLHTAPTSAGTKESTGHAARLIREARAAAALDHPNVVAIFDVGEVGDTTFLAMELIEGRTLRSCIGEDVAIGARLAWLVDIAATLAFAHSRGFVHRDIKPENVMIRADGVLKVLDFGIARRARALPTAATMPASGPANGPASGPASGPANGQAKGPAEGSGWATGEGRSTFAGTPHYMAPEQMHGLALDGRADQFAWGVVAYELLTGGAMPWPDADDLVALVAAVIGSDPTPLPAVPGLPAHVPAVVMRALRRAPGERFAGMEELLAALQQRARTSGPGTSMREVVRRADAFAETISGAPPAVRRAGGAARRLVIAGLMVSLVGGIASYGLLRERPAEPGVAAQAGPRRSVAVIGFRNLSGRTEVGWIATALGEMMTTELALGEQLRTVTVDEVERMKRELALTDIDALGQAQLASVGRRLGTELVVTGSYLAIGEKIRLDVRLIDIASGEALVSVSESDRETELIDLVARAGASLRRSLRADELSTEQASDLRASVPASPEAARLYATGLASLRAFDARAARAALEQVTTREPGFALGHAALADALTVLGMRDAAIAASERALALAQPLRREERLVIEVRHLVATGAWEQALVVARNLHELFPDDLDHGLRLVEVQTQAGRMKDALASLGELRGLPPPLGDDPRLDLAEAHAYSLLGDATGAERAAASALVKAEAVGATTIAMRARLIQGWRLLDVGDNDRGAELLTQLRGQVAGLGEPMFVIDVVYALATAEMLRDELRTAAELGEEGVSAARRLGNQELTADLEVNFAGTLIRLGRLDEAGRSLANAALASPTSRGAAAVLRGHIALLRGDLAGAQAALLAGLQPLRELDDERMVAWVQALRGEVALEEDRLDDAEALTRESLASRTRMRLAPFVAESQLLLARIALARGRHEEAVTLARAAAEAYATARARSEEAEAQAWLVQALLAGGRAVDLPLARAQELAARTENPRSRLLVALASARVAEARGDRAGAGRGLAEVIAEAERLGLEVLALAGRLAAGRLEIAAGRVDAGRVMLADVVADTQRRGLIRLARAAQAAGP